MKNKINYTKAQFLKDVEKEVRALKKTATKDELLKLDFDNLDPDSGTRCIYGQITGECSSPRASELIFRCCARYVENLPDNGHHEFPAAKGFNVVKPLINGTSIEGVTDLKSFRQHRGFVLNYFSSLETYIMLPNAKNKNLIAYLRGERKNLVL